MSLLAIARAQLDLCKDSAFLAVLPHICVLNDKYMYYITKPSNAVSHTFAHKQAAASKAAANLIQTDMHRLLTIISLAVYVVGAAAQEDIHVAKYHGDRKAAVSYTFDDGLKEHYTMVFPQLRRRGLKATFGIVGSKVGRDMKGTPCLTWAELRQMAADGQEIASHGWEHRNVTTLSTEALRHEVQRNDSAIYDSVGVRPTTYFYPGNRKTPETVAFCSQGRIGTRTSQVSIGSKRDSLWLRSWVEGLLARGEWGVGMTHGITRGYDAFANPQVLWSHFDYVCTLRDSLWIAPMCDVAAYMAERDTVKLEIKRSGGNTIVRPSMKLAPTLFRHPLTLVATVSTPVTATQDGHQLNVAVHDGKATIDFDPNGGEIVITNK